MAGHGSIGDRDANDELFELYSNRVLAFALRRTPDRATAEDVTAETFAIAWRRRDTHPDRPLAWLYSIALKVLSNQRRSSRRRRRLRQRVEAQPVVFGRDPAELIEDRDEIRAAFLELKESQREVLRLAFWEDLSPADAAAVLGCSEGAFRVRLHRARSTLAKHLEPGGHEDHDEHKPSSRLADSRSQEAR